MVKASNNLNFEKALELKNMLDNIKITIKLIIIGIETLLKK